MPRDRRVGFKRQAEFAKAARPPLGRLSVSLQAGKNPSSSKYAGRLPIEIDRNRAADQLAAAAEDRDRMLFRTVGGKQRLLGRAAGMPERDRLPRIELDSSSP